MLMKSMTWSIREVYIVHEARQEVRTIVSFNSRRPTNGRCAEWLVPRLPVSEGVPRLFRARATEARLSGPHRHGRQSRPAAYRRRELLRRSGSRGRGGERDSD